MGLGAGDTNIQLIADGERGCVLKSPGTAKMQEGIKEMLWRNSGTMSTVDSDG